MNLIRQLLLVVVGALLGAKIGHSSASHEFSEMLQEMNPQEDNLVLVVAKQAMQPGDTFSEETAAVRLYPERLTPSYSVTADDYRETLHGKTVTRSLERGDLISRYHIEGCDPKDQSLIE